MAQLDQRPGFAELLEIVGSVGRTHAHDGDADTFPPTDSASRTKIENSLSVLADATDRLALAAPDIGCSNRIRAAELAALGRILRTALVAVPESLIAAEILNLGKVADRAREEVKAREKRIEDNERARVYARIVEESKTLSVGDILREVEAGGARLFLDGDQIKYRGGNLTHRLRTLIDLRRCHVVDALRAAERSEAV